MDNTDILLTVSGLRRVHNVTRGNNATRHFDGYSAGIRSAGTWT
jgi:hypothetical protein